MPTGMGSPPVLIELSAVRERGHGGNLHRISTEEFPKK